MKIQGDRRGRDEVIIVGVSSLIIPTTHSLHTHSLNHFFHYCCCCAMGGGRQFCYSYSTV